MKTELYICWRYLLTKRKEKFISLISIISIMGIAIGVAALIIVIGVMTGFDRDLRDKIVGNYSHLTLSGYQPIETASVAGLAAKIEAVPHVVGVSPYIQGQALAKEGKRFFAVGLRGINPQTDVKVTKLKDYIVTGSLSVLGKDSIIIGKELAAYLGLRLGSNLVLRSASGKEYTLKVCAIFQSGMYDYDLNLAFVNLECAEQILEMPGLISAVAIKLDDLYLAGKMRGNLAAVAGPEYDIKTWMEVNKNFFAALELEKFTMFIILTLIILVASFNIISTLVVMVVEKTKDIGILKALGMSAASIRRIFTYLGLCIGVVGVLIGAFTGVFLCGLLKKYQFIKLPQDVYYVSNLPVAVALWPDVAVIVASALAIVLISTFYPANKAAALKPVEALRYE